MRAPIVGIVLAAFFCALAMASCDPETTEDFMFNDDNYSANQQEACFERAHYPLGLWTAVHGDFYHGFGRLQATYDRYHFSYIDTINAATTLPIESLALEGTQHPTSQLNRPDPGVPAGISEASQTGRP